MHDFDATQRQQQQTLTDEFGDHAFTLRGETFHIRRIIPFGAIRLVAGMSDTSTDTDAFLAVETAVLALLRTPEDRERFKKVIYDTDTDFPVTYLDMLEIQGWMIREASGRPPTQPASSSESQSTNGANATATSSPAPDAASTS